MTMWERLKRWFALPEIEGDEETRRTAVLLNVILWTEMGVVLASSPLILVTRVQAAIVPVVVLLVLVGAMLFVLRAGRVRLAGILFLINLWLVATGLLFMSGGLNHQTTSSYFVIVLVAGLLFGWKSAAWLTAASGLVITAAFVIEQLGIAIPTPLVASPVFDISIMLSNLVMGAVLLSLTMRNLRDALISARQSSVDLEQQRERLQDLVEERSRELARRTGYLGAATAVAQEAQLASGDLTRLLPRVVRVISEQFGFYHTGLFLLDASKKWMELQAASSEGGQRMLARQHRLEVGSQSIVGYVASRGERRIALDVGQDAVFFDNPDLPDTRSEMAVPLRVGGEILGVLDVQSTERQAFTDEDITTLQALADQVAMAVNNAQLLRQVEASAEA
ncbi:MAG: GAF domain-containing protein, partial [Anaerolineae bacterium]